MSTSTVDLHPFEQALRKQVRGEVSFDLTTRGLYATDASHYQIMPMCVVCPLDEDDATAAVRVAGEHGISITPRGGGTSLSGQTHGPGMILDVSRHMNQLLELNVEEHWARVGPGMVRDTLNGLLKPHGLHFSPDPATGNRAAIGGMIGNNASGTRSIVYGKTIDHILELKVVLADGTILELGPKTQEQWSDLAARRGREGEIHRGVSEVIRANHDEIQRRFPRVMRRVSGYNLDAFVENAGPGPSLRSEPARTKPWNLCDLIVGSEGTLATVLEAKLDLDPLPKATALCIVHFHDLIESLRAVAPILEHHPSTVELLDDVILDEALRNRSTRELAHFIEGEPKAVLIVEMFGDTPQAVADRAQTLADDLRARGIGHAWPVLTDARGQADVWTVRKLGLGLISNVKGPRKGQAFVEDACLPIPVLPEYIERLLSICKHEDVPVSVYAHASVGVLHVRPMLDLHLDQDVRKMKRIADQAFDMVVAYGGAWSGEHGDGLVRGEFIKRFFGDQIYDAFREIKRLFDPNNLMNPGKIIDPPPMTENLRYGRPGYSQRIAEVASHYHYREQDGFALAVEQCNGVGACRKIGSGTMCPSYMATRDEEASTRGRANALRLAMSGQLDLEGGMTGDRLHEVLDLCLQCKACKSECPNEVDMAKLKSDVLQMRHDKFGLPLGSRLMGDSPRAAKLIAGPLAPLVNAVQSLSPYKWLMEKLTGIDRRRPLPRFARKSLTSRLAAHHPSPTRGGRVGESTDAASARPDNDPQSLNLSSPNPSRGEGGHETLTKREDAQHRQRVILFDDTYMNYYEPGIGVAAVELLESCGYEVTLARAGCCQRPRLSKGMVRAAKRDGEKTLRDLDALSRNALPILCIEPSCASALTDDLPDLMDDVELGKRVAGQVRLLATFLAQELEAGRLDHVRFDSSAQNILLHGHCHQKSLFNTDGIKTLFACVPGVTLEEVDSGCCGMAGSFGYEHYDVSMTIGEQRLFPAVRAAMEKDDQTAICATGFSCRHQIRDGCGSMPTHWVRLLRATANPPS